MSTNENIPETVEQQVEKKMEVKRARNKRSMDRAVEESVAIIESLGPEPELAEGRRRTRSVNKGISTPNKSEATPSPAKKPRKSSTPGMGRGRPRKPGKIIVETDNSEETITNNEVAIEKPESSAADKVDAGTNGHAKDSEIISENGNDNKQSEPEPMECHVAESSDAKTVATESADKAEQPLPIAATGASSDAKTVVAESADKAEPSPIAATGESKEDVVPTTEQPEAVVEENGTLNDESQKKTVIAETAPGPDPVPVPAPETKVE